ncbi:M56 family metallopeptidase [Microcoleus sp. FACHB-672]|uniref:M56 family metallopeptidase n=1 Tax=Microcoleus sp. FACHB-672 TaxID=2692825 RepID=UPI0016822D93|nr:M56 family metallopeptidase [Microcoleus sp. FACHB-672]MBD2039320.1 M56 family metallopeptidase [Microcoleus sp. FACHB-672]
MHLLMILAALAFAWCVRKRWVTSAGNWRERWQRAIMLFLFPPLLLIMTAIAVLFMGPSGQMVGLLTDWLSYAIASGFLGLAGVLCVKLATQGWKTLQKTRTYCRRNINGIPARILDTNALFTAQIGFWHPELVVSEGLLQTLDSAHLEAVFAHEQAHYYYRDTFWFFWLGWVRSCTTWLPNTEALWQELLVLRELRADAKAAQQVDSLILAESLLLVVSVLPAPSESFCAALSAVAPRSRLEERIEALLAQPEEQSSINRWFWMWLLLAFLPLLTVPFHG